MTDPSSPYAGDPATLDCTDVCILWEHSFGDSKSSANFCLQAALTRTMNALGRKTKTLKDGEANLGGDHIREGLTAIISVKVPEPEFEGQTKTRLGNPEVRKILDSVLTKVCHPMHAAGCMCGVLVHWSSVWHARLGSISDSGAQRNMHHIIGRCPSTLSAVVLFDAMEFLTFACVWTGLVVTLGFWEAER